jgi:hypothetical protein
MGDLSGLGKSGTRQRHRGARRQEQGLQARPEARSREAQVVWGKTTRSQTVCVNRQIVFAALRKHSHDYTNAPCFPERL